MPHNPESKEFLERVRERIKIGFDHVSNPRNQRDWSGSPICIKEVAQWAVRTDLPGFEDPRVAAVDLMGRDYHECSRIGCNGVYGIKSDDTVDERVPCSGVNECLKTVWDEMNDHKNQDKPNDDPLAAFPSQAGSEQIGYLCLKLGCRFSCGYTFAGKGQHGTCVMEDQAEYSLIIDFTGNLQYIVLHTKNRRYYTPVFIARILYSNILTSIF